VDDSAIVLVTDSTLCSRAIAVYNAADSTQFASSLYVIRVGSVNVASNPDLPAGEYIYNYVLDANFNFLTAFFN